MVGLFDALIFGGAFDSCLDRATDRRDSTASVGRLHDKEQGVSSQGEHSTSFHLPQPPLGAASPPRDTSGGVALQGGIPSRGDGDDSLPSSVDYPEAGPSLIGPPTLNIHVGAQPFGAASGLAHQHSYLHHHDQQAGAIPLPPALAIDAVSELTDPGLLAPLPGSSVTTAGGASAVVGGPPGMMRGRIRVFATTYNGAWGDGI